MRVLTVMTVAGLCLLSTPFSRVYAAKIWVCGDPEKVSPASGSLMHKSWSSFSSDTSYQKVNFHWNGSSRTVSLEAARGEVLGFQVIIDREDEELSPGILATGIPAVPTTRRIACRSSGDYRY